MPHRSPVGGKIPGDGLECDADGRVDGSDRVLPVDPRMAERPWTDIILSRSARAEEPGKIQVRANVHIIP